MPATLSTESNIFRAWKALLRISTRYAGCAHTNIDLGAVLELPDEYQNLVKPSQIKRKSANDSNLFSSMIVLNHPLEQCIGLIIAIFGY